MDLDVTTVSPQQLERAAQFYDEHGYLRLSGLQHGITGAFEKCLADAIGISVEDFQPLLDPHAGAAVFSHDVRQRLSRIATTPPLAQTLVSRLAPILSTLIGPLAHVSSTYHGQFKGGALNEASRDIATYHNEGKADYMEVHGAYRLHQDFTGASLPTSPSGVTLWVALNACPESTLRLFPGSHRLGLFCHKMWKTDDPRLELLPAPVDFEARAGTGVLFNALLFHGTGKLGSLRRVSCDIRFYPLTGFLPSDVHALEADPLERLHHARARAAGDTLLAPILEQLAYLGEDVAVEPRPALSVLNWANYLVELMHGQPDAALPHLSRFINTDLLEDPPSVFTRKFHNRELQTDRLRTVRERVAESRVRH